MVVIKKASKRVLSCWCSIEKLHPFVEGVQKLFEVQEKEKGSRSLDSKTEN